MSRRSSGRKAFPGILIAAVCIFLMPGISNAAEPDRVIPIVRDGSGVDIQVEIASDGSRRTATPCVTVARPVAEESESPCSIGTLRRRAAQAKVSRPAVAIPEEITARDAKRAFKALRAAWKGKQALRTAEPAVGQDPVRVASQR
ncbi:MAG: hypothetical protein C4529_03135 [Deltaproteobacteria bacterium]|nr:MAG: hypothetical protein C4529_03135 [Deltaproteobacteria bacterium]